MENENTKVIQVFLGIILIVLVVLVVLLVTLQPVSQNSNVIITNSYNTYSTYDKDYNNNWRNFDGYEDDEDKNRYNLRELDYDDWGKHYTRDGTFRNGFDEFVVYVRNEEDVGGYFTVKFYFDNSYGNIDSKKITYYLRAHEGKKFVYKDIYETGNNYAHWDYEVVSNSQIRMYS